jgi:ligand-binding sensor domain-containing protein
MVNVATANGLVRFDGDGSEQQVLTRADGLIADHVTDVANYRGGLAVATPAGLTFLDSSGARSLYAFQGLVNNHVYALGVAGDELLAGTLGGISVLDRGDISASFTTKNSGLKHNWITAVARLDSGWLVGTYGAGIVQLDSSGKFESLQFEPMQKATGNFEVNPNALFVTPELALAGTLDDGLYVLDRGSGRWSEVLDGLPSRNVTALAAANGYFYIGTDNGLVRIAADALKAKVRP